LVKGEHYRKQAGFGKKIANPEESFATEAWFFM